MSVKITSCLNCGAPLSGPVCQYCGTSYGDERAPMSITIDDDSLRGTLVFKGCSFAVRLREIEMEHYDTVEAARSLDGRLYVGHQSHPTITFVLEGQALQEDPR